MEVFRQTDTGTILDSLRIKPDNLEVTRTARARKRLQSQVRVLRHYDGAEIMDPENMVPSSCFNLTSEQQRDAAIERLKLERMLAVAMATHDRLGKHSPLHDLHRAEDCLKLIRTYVKKGYDALDLVGGRLSDCALAHWPIVQSLSEEQLAEFYELACIERWGEQCRVSSDRTTARAWVSVMMGLHRSYAILAIAICAVCYFDEQFRADLVAGLKSYAGDSSKWGFALLVGTRTRTRTRAPGCFSLCVLTRPPAGTQMVSSRAWLRSRVFDVPQDHQTLCRGASGPCERAGLFFETYFVCHCSPHNM